MLQAESQHRDHAIVEQVIADAAASALAHLPDLPTARQRGPTADTSGSVRRGTGPVSMMITERGPRRWGGGTGLTPQDGQTRVQVQKASTDLAEVGWIDCYLCHPQALAPLNTLRT